MTNNADPATDITELHPADMSQDDYTKMKLRLWEENNPEPTEPERPTMGRACTVKFNQHYAWVETVLNTSYGNDGVAIRFFHNGLGGEEALALEELEQLITELIKAKQNHAKLSAYHARKKSFDELSRKWSNERYQIENRARENWSRAVSQRKREETKKSAKKTSSDKAE